MSGDERRFTAAATQLGITVAEYLEKRGQGLKWCSGVKHWEPVANFGNNNSTGDGLSVLCRSCLNADNRARRERNRKRNLARQSADQLTVN